MTRTFKMSRTFRYHVFRVNLCDSVPLTMQHMQHTLSFTAQKSVAVLSKMQWVALCKQVGPFSGYGLVSNLLN